ncbi:beta-ketoacyl-ACP synthase [Anaeromyxobacter oryzisoli]|uniref:beta-ketoacyl-ACP synthase n=1 Tax=Anaeromyxobacter oryzisoli TaxID=2925408 RepID=UPI001F56F99C|nr:beta-ketoacyl-ACP synthase [Anaeromyxobacter sp. SG63]
MGGHRVVITGVGVTSPIGNSLDEISAALREGRSGVRQIPALGEIANMKTRLGAPAEVDLSPFPKKRTRTMGRVALLSTFATQNAIADAGLDPERLSSGHVGLAYGSTGGTSAAVVDFVEKLYFNRSLDAIQSATYLKFMSHTCAANLAQYFAIRGRVVTTCSACVSGSQAIGAGYEAVRGGQQEVMICGGAEEMDVVHAAIFDVMYAASSRYNDQPTESPRPFDADRDGLVVGEGAATLVLERYDHARARGARVYGEIVGFATNCDGLHMTAPSEDGMARVIELALADAQLAPDRIDYVNAHATATDLGDVCESRAVLRTLGAKVPISSTKGFTGHTLGACGAIESLFCLAMIRDGFLAPNRNLARPHPDCASLDYVIGAPRAAGPALVMNNNFAFAGINTSLVFKAV